MSPAAQRHLVESKGAVIKAVNWCLEPSQPQKYIAGLKTNFIVSPSYSTYKTSDHKLFKIYKMSPDTNYDKSSSIRDQVKRFV